MKKIYSFIASALIIMTGCVEKETTPAPAEGNKVKLTISVDYPQGDGQTKVAFEDGDTPAFAWTGDETLSVLVGKLGTTTKKADGLQLTLNSVPGAPGTFSGEIDLGEFSVEDIQGIVVPAENGAFFGYNNSKDRINMPVATEQTQTIDGVFNPEYVPFFARFTHEDLGAADADGSYSVGGVQFYSGTDLIKFNVYGKHSGMSDDEVLKSVRIETDNRIVGESRWTLGQTETGLGSNSNGSHYVVVNFEGNETIADKDKTNGIELFASVILGGSRTFNRVEITTDKATYVKSVDKTISRATTIDVLYVHQVAFDLSTFSRVGGGAMYSVDEGQTWASELPAALDGKLAVKTQEGASLAEDNLAEIKALIDAAAEPVSLDLSQAAFEPSTFPATFAGESKDAPYEKLKAIKFPSNVTAVADGAFKFCGSLESVDLGKITSIGYAAFERTALTTLELGNQITSLGQYAFANCYYLTEVYFNATDEGYATATSAGTNTYTFQFDSGVEHSCDLTFTVGPDAYIGRHMLRRNTNLTKLVFEYTGESVRRMGNNSMIDTKNLKTVECKGATPNVWFYHGALTNVGVNHGSDVEKQLIVPAGTTEAYEASRLYLGFANETDLTNVGDGNPDGLQDFGFVIVEAAN